MKKEEYKISLDIISNESESFLKNIDTIPPNVKINNPLVVADISNGKGIANAFSFFKEKYGDKISATIGPNFYGFVTGGTTPAALLGDWLTSLYDQCSPVTDVSNILEKETIEQAKSLFGISADFNGSLVSGGTVSNMVSLSIARQWLGEQNGIDFSDTGMINSNINFKIFSATPHSSILKSLSIIGIGKNNIEAIGTLDNREAIDIDKLKSKLMENKGVPTIVIGNAGTVNSGDFDDFTTLKELKEEFDFWLHIDGAFGGFASCSRNHKHFLADWNCADSITIDAHKWLNVPYDSAFQFTKHTNLQSKVFQNGNAPYLDGLADSYINLTPENSRRWRALPIWFSFQAYGKDGISEMIERTCNFAVKTGEWINNSPQLTLLAETRLNIVCFKVADNLGFSTEQLLTEINKSNKVFLTPTIYNDEYAIRIAFSNWSTNLKNVEEMIAIIADRIDFLS